MSDYSSTWTKVTGNTVEVADFTTEYDAIATSSATKANKTGAPATTNNLAMLNASGDLADSLVETDGAGNITADVTGNADTATNWDGNRTITLTGDVTGATTNASGTKSIATTLAANSVSTNEIAASGVRFNNEIALGTGTGTWTSTTTIPRGVYVLRLTSSGAGSVTVSAVSVGGSAATLKVLAAAGDGIQVVSDGTNYSIDAKVGSPVDYEEVFD